MDDKKIIGKLSLMVVLILQALSASFIAASRPLINNTAIQSMAGGRTLVFELTEIHHLSLPIGDPAKSFTFDVDSGSSLIWVQCGEQCEGCNLDVMERYKPGEDNKVPRNDPLCSANLRSKDPNICDFHVRYMEGLRSSGYLVKDRFTWGTESTNSAVNLAVGCAGYMKIGKAPFTTAGILGLGQDVVSFPSQLKAAGVVTHNVIGHCLKLEGGGFLFIGDDYVPASGVIWTPMLTEQVHYYGSGPVHFLFDGKATSIGTLRKVAFDSGTTYTCFPSETYKGILKEVNGNINRDKLLIEVQDGEGVFSVCWQREGKKPFESWSDVSRYFKTITLRFENQAELLLQPKDYLEVLEGRLVVCLAIFEAKDKNFGIIGETSMLEKTVIYDNEKKQIGWKSGDCVIPPSTAEPLFTTML